jgi:hypothetical protein
MNRPDEALAELVRRTGEIPLGWAGATSQMDYLNFGDALSAVMVALVGGKPVRRVPFKSKSKRLAAVGTIGHGFEGGEVWFWGTGCSDKRNPSAPAAERQPYAPPADSRFFVRATRGPVSERLLNGGAAGSGVYGDPVWVLPRFYRPSIQKKWKLGCILHLSELADRSYAARPHEHLKRYEIPAELSNDIRLITTVTPIGVAPLKDKIDEILSCERIVSTSLHGMVIAESYGVPCLYFSPAESARGLTTVALDPAGRTDLRIVDLYRGVGSAFRDFYMQPRLQPTDWADLMGAIDRSWQPIEFSGDDLLGAFPVDADPIRAEHGGDIWDHPIVTGLKLQHDVAEIRRADAASARA